jgi:hypothetical protein
MIENRLIHQMNGTNGHVIDDDPTEIIENKKFRMIHMHNI